MDLKYWEVTVFDFTAMGSASSGFDCTSLASAFLFFDMLLYHTYPFLNNQEWGYLSILQFELILIYLTFNLSFFPQHTPGV